MSAAWLFNSGTCMVRVIPAMKLFLLLWMILTPPMNLVSLWKPLIREDIVIWKIKLMLASNQVTCPMSPRHIPAD